jgi:uncharacterized protein (TIGR02147 family)
MSIFKFKDYRSYLRGYIQQLPKNGRGELSRIAKHLEINTTLLSQIMSGTRDFNPEQALALSEYLAHSEIEADYFSYLVQHRRAGTAQLRSHLGKKIEQIRDEALKLSKRISHDMKLTDNQRAIFYSSWIYSAVHLFTSTKQKGVTLVEIADRFEISKNKTAEIIQFLINSGLCIEKLGYYSMGVQSTFVERGSPDLIKHHANWRLKAIQKSESLSEQELMYSGQFSLSNNDFEVLREQIAEFLKRTNKTIKESPAEIIAGLNIDWFWIER